MRRWNAALTVEAAVIMPMVLILLAAAMHIGIELYMETEALAAEIQKREELPILEMFRQTERLGEMFDEGN